MFKDKASIVSFANLFSCQQEVSVICVLKHVLQIFQELLSLDPASHILLNGNGIVGPSFEIEFEKVPRLVTSEQTLNQNAWTVSLVTSLESVDVNF